MLGYEALARPRSAELAGPGEAFEIADSIGRGHELDAVCRRATLRAASELPAGALLFLNVSPQTLEHDGLAGDSLVLAVRGAGYEPEQVVLEITERTDARKEVLVPEAARLRALGFKLALDDVGAGNAGLEMLRALPVDFIKIDRAVVANAVEDRGARAVMLGIMAFARESGSFVIAEGIETEAMLELARDPDPDQRGPPRRRPRRAGLPARQPGAGSRRGAELRRHARDADRADRRPRAPPHRGRAAARRRALPRAAAHGARHDRGAVRQRPPLPARRRRPGLARRVARDPRGPHGHRGARATRATASTSTRCCAPCSPASRATSNGSAALSGARLSVQAVPVRDERAGVIGVMAVCRDVTLRHEVDAALRSSRAQPTGAPARLR